MNLQDKLALLKASDEEKTNTNTGVVGRGDVEMNFTIECLSSMSPKYSKAQQKYHRARIEAGEDTEKLGNAFIAFMADITAAFTLDGDKLTKADIKGIYKDNSQLLMLAHDTAREDEPFIKALPKDSKSGQRDSSNSGKK